jgi:hypothetical protein
LNEKKSFLHSGRASLSSYAIPIASILKKVSMSHYDGFSPVRSGSSSFSVVTVIELSPINTPTLNGREL